MLLGSVSRITDVQGNILERQHFLPSGGYRAPIGNDYTPRGFTNHQHNDDLGLIYMNARYYLPSAGRFISADTIVPDPTNPQSFNRYSYVYNNPIKYNDPSGHIACDHANLPGMDQAACTYTGFSGVSPFRYPSALGTAGAISGHPAAMHLINQTGGFEAVKALHAHNSQTVINFFRTMAGILFEPIDWAATGYEALSGQLSGSEIQVAVLLAALPFAQGGWGDEVVDVVRNSDAPTVPARDIFWSQDGVSWSTTSGVPLDDLSQDIATGWNGPPLRVLEMDGQLVSLDNRRLTAAKIIDANVPISVVDLSNPAIDRIWRRRDNIRDIVNIRGANLSVNMQGELIR